MIRITIDLQQNAAVGRVEVSVNGKSIEGCYPAEARMAEELMLAINEYAQATGKTIELPGLTIIKSKRKTEAQEPAENGGTP